MTKPTIYRLRVGYKHSQVNLDTLRKEVRRNPVSASLDMQRKTTVLKFEFGQSPAFYKAFSRLKESGMKLRLLSEKEKDTVITPLPAVSNCRKL